MSTASNKSPEQDQTLLRFINRYRRTDAGDTNCLHVYVTDAQQRPVQYAALVRYPYELRTLMADTRREFPDCDLYAAVRRPVEAAVLVRSARFFIRKAPDG